MLPLEVVPPYKRDFQNESRKKQLIRSAQELLSTVGLQDFQSNFLGNYQEECGNVPRFVGH
jgi:hypothetical protein